MKLKIIIGLGILASFFFTSGARAYDEVAVTNGGTIRGTVKAERKIPKLRPPEITKFKEFCRNVPDESLVARQSGGLRYAVVAIEGITKGKAVEREAVLELDNVGCRFVPHVQAASVGQFLLIKNSDPILHTAHAYFPKDQPHFNVGLFPGKVTRKPLVSAGVVKIVCEVHPWMASYFVVTEHPYHAVTDAYGEYEIRDVPAGRYRLKVWHERLGVQEKEVEVKGGSVSKLDFALPLEGVKK
jgi:hypothetical protein